MSDPRHVENERIAGEEAAQLSSRRLAARGRLFIAAKPLSSGGVAGVNESTR
ncbi:MAG: hypothetical protein WCD76_10905 [Pyrinomonadaceae bacterium]